MTPESLKQVRESWYAAYYAGDIKCLIQIQTDGFTVTTEQGVQSRKSQIDAIHSAKRRGCWFPQGGSKQDTELTLQNSGTGYRVTGKGYAFSGESKGPLVAFSESWEWDGAGWRVSSLRYGTIGK